jgi:hypothetical protein
MTPAEKVRIGQSIVASRLAYFLALGKFTEGFFHRYSSRIGKEGKKTHANRGKNQDY